MTLFTICLGGGYGNAFCLLEQIKRNTHTQGAK